MRRRQILPQRVGYQFGTAPTPAERPPEPRYSALSDDDLIAAYVAKFGDRPHHRMKRETIEGKLENDDSQ